MLRSEEAAYEKLDKTQMEWAPSAQYIEVRDTKEEVDRGRKEGREGGRKEERKEGKNVLRITGVGLR